MQVVQTSAQRPYNQTYQINLAWLRDPVLLQAAQRLYHIYLELPHLQQRRPLGIVINIETYRAVLIYKGLPALLPQECFVPLDQIE